MTSGKLEYKPRRVNFGDVVRLVKERCQDPASENFERYVGLEHIEPEDLRIRQWGSVADGTTFTNVFRPGQVLFGKRRAYQRKVAVADFSGVCSGDIYVLESSDPDVLLPELLPFICQTEAFFRHAVGTSAGSLSPRTNWTSLAAFEFALPPFQEQRRIVELVTASYEQVLVFETAMQAAQLSAKSFRNELASLPARDATLRDVLSGSPESGCSAPPVDQKTGHFVLGLGALSVNGYKHGDYKAVHATDKMMDAKLSKGDLLISRSNTVDRVGFVGIFDEDRDDVSFPDTMMRCPVNQDIVEPRYLEALLQTSPARQFIMRIAAGTSASMKKINRENLLKLRLPVPDLDTQREHLLKLDDLLVAADLVSQRLSVAKQLHGTLLATTVVRGAT